MTLSATMGFLKMGLLSLPRVLGEERHTRGSPPNPGAVGWMHPLLDGGTWCCSPLPGAVRMPGRLLTSTRATGHWGPRSTPALQNGGL